MKLKYMFLTTLLLVSMSSSVFAQDPAVLAVVNGKKITVATLDAIIKQAVANGQEDTPEFRNNLKEQLIYQEAIYQEADKLGFGKKPDILEQLDQARKTIFVRALMIDYIEKNPVTEADIKQEYAKSKAAVTGEKEYSARHILVDTEDEAKAVIAKLKSGSSFEELAKLSKDTQSAANGGLLDWAPGSTYVAPFTEALKSLKKGETTQTPVKSQFGYHVIRLEDVRDIKFPELEEIKGKITQTLQRQKLEAYQDSIRNKATVQ